MCIRDRFLVGDSKQAIFGFQGGSIKNFEEFKKSCKPMILGENMRSTQEILDYSKNYFLENKYRREGRVNKDDNRARQIIIAVNIPKVENKGIGAKPIIAKPITLDIADPNKATPVPLIELFKASYLFGCFDNSSLNLIVI